MGVLLVLLPATALHAQRAMDPPPDTLAHLHGVVILQNGERTGLFLEGAFLHLEGTGFATRTGVEGRFDMGEVPPGSYELTLHHPVWEVRELEPPTSIFTLPRGEITELEWVVPSPDLRGTLLDPYPIEGLTVTVDREALKRRAEGAGVKYVGEDEIARLRGRGYTVADLVRDRFSTLRTVPTRTFGQACVQTRRMGEDGYQILTQRVNPSPDCPDQVAVIVDGVKVSDPSAYLPTLSLDGVESVEFVPGLLASIRYGTGFAGGALVIETRR